MSLLNRPKVDMSKMTDEEKKMFRLYGKLPTAKDVLNHKLKDRKYFDSGDYALSKAGKQATVGSKHPSPDSIPHSSPSTHENKSNAVVNSSKESSLTHQQAEGAGKTEGTNFSSSLSNSSNQLDQPSSKEDSTSSS